MAVITVFIIIFLIPTVQELIHWFLPVGICVQVSKLDINYGISLGFPYSLNEYVISCLQSAPPLTYLLLLYAAALVN